MCHIREAAMCAFYVVSLLIVWILASVGAHILYSSRSDVIVHFVMEGFKEPHFAPFLLLALLINKQFPSVAGSSCGALPARVHQYVVRSA
jgi:hypothetical protein